MIGEARTGSDVVPESTKEAPIPVGNSASNIVVLLFVLCTVHAPVCVSFDSIYVRHFWGIPTDCATTGRRPRRRGAQRCVGGGRGLVLMVRVSPFSATAARL